MLATPSGRVLGRGLGGPSNHVEAPGGRDRLRRAVIDSTNAALRDAGLADIESQTFAAVYCAMTGEADFKTEVITPLFRATVIRVEHDAPAALAGATLGAPGHHRHCRHRIGGVRREWQRRTARTGGWGYVFGDEGSGFGLARDGVRAALDALDEVGPETALVSVLTRRFAVDDLRLLPMVMYNGHISRDGVAAAARDVLETWLAGNPVATGVVAHGVDSLARRVRTVAARLHSPTRSCACRAGCSARLPTWPPSAAPCVGWCPSHASSRPDSLPAPGPRCWQFAPPVFS